MDQTVRRIIEGPKLADLGQIETKFLSLMKAWTETRTYTIEHSAHLLTAWAKAASAFGAKLNEAAAGRPLSSRSEVIALWVEIANQHLFEVQRSAPFLETQRNLLRASSALKRAQQELSELYGETLGLPTRSEIDDLTRTVAELKREFRADRRKRKTRLDQAVGQR
jgi:pyrroloquinoline quinone (PQQ) biosynthesis protein C